MTLYLYREMWLVYKVRSKPDVFRMISHYYPETITGPSYIYIGEYPIL